MENKTKEADSMKAYGYLDVEENHNTDHKRESGVKEGVCKRINTDFECRALSNMQNVGMWRVGCTSTNLQIWNN